MAHYDLQVSGHGMDKGLDKFTVAHGWEFKFFVKMGEVLDYPTSEEIYQDLAVNDLSAVNKRVKHTYFSGSSVDNYVLCDLEDPHYVSGVLQAGSTVPVVSIEGVTQQKPIMLSNLLTLAIEELGIKVGSDSVNVYFNACRS